MVDDRLLRQEIAGEQEHVSRVYERLTALRAAAESAEAEGYKVAQVGNSGALVERDALVYHAARRRHVFDAEHEGLVFGRLDLRPDHDVDGPSSGAADASGSPRYIGRLGMRGEDARPLLIDWRAPAAAAFYRATAAQPLGVVRRRLITSVGERVTGLEDDLLDPAHAPRGMTIVGDGALISALSRSKGAGMRDIVATIQQEQDLAIRSPASGVTLVEGGPGTGKTAVALHRAAYLLYSDRARFAGGGVLVVGPSPVFVAYIAAVLPGLGEDSATLRAVGQLVVGVDASRQETAAVRAVKGSLRMCRVLRRAAEDEPPGAPGDLRIRYRREWVELSHVEAEGVRRKIGKGRRRNEIRAEAFRTLLDLLWHRNRRRLAPLSREQFDDDLADHEGFRHYLRAWWPIVTPSDILGWLADETRLARYGDGILAPFEQELLVESMAVTRLRGPSVDDAALIDELEGYVGHKPRPKRPEVDPFTVAGKRELSTAFERERARRERQRPADYRDYAHIVVDEAQDITPLQWRMLGRRGQLASWTLVGDPVQSAWIGDTAEQADARADALGGKEVRRYVLQTNYRNSTEIFAAAAEVIGRALPTARLPLAVRSTGVWPVHLVVDPSQMPAAVSKAVTDMMDAVPGSVGLILPDADCRAQADTWLSAGARAVPRLRLVTAIEAKGMEYDAVVLVEPGLIEGASVEGWRTLYVALSRATQRLVTVATAPWRAEGAPHGQQRS
ncbi:ATP-dependent DNA helicase [Micromonospora aurantiaca]|uniref:HelD family protein n=1 Tax=Micromonospora aurantiaca (nom. illeg.) TaxID=47850 RepID=UPI000F3F1578|nr:ATP-binding domain-containing protein [Micromonospora aurantiaca]RNH98168.1 ATP-dependent DNA helicase [Micromonospora aurantiaca]